MLARVGICFDFMATMCVAIKLKKIIIYGNSRAFTVIHVLNLLAADAAEIL